MNGEVSTNQLAVKAIPMVHTTPIGTALPAGITDEKELKSLGQLAHEVLQDPMKMQHLSEMVLHHLRRDMAYQWERDHGYGRRS
jgi:hypothetical protein